MQTILIDLSPITDESSFHQIFADSFGFPEYYGNNMDAWIDCMSSLDDTPNQASNVQLAKGELLTLQLHNVSSFKESNRELYDELIECSAFVNFRRIEKGYGPVLVVSFSG